MLSCLPINHPISFICIVILIHWSYSFIGYQVMRNEEVEGKRVMTDGGWRVIELSVKTKNTRVAWGEERRLQMRVKIEVTQGPTLVASRKRLSLTAPLSLSHFSLYLIFYSWKEEQMKCRERAERCHPRPMCCFSNVQDFLFI